ncbi:MAG: hypothetical protein JNJ60_21440, partial [Rhodocyclaceae bacterium]|nr:hypothetical protein [Rhodocyclaceae bacterium]
MRWSALGYAHLLDMFATLPREQWQAAADAAGFVARLPSPQREPEKPVPETRRDAPPPASEAPRAAAPYQPSDLPDLPFWRVNSRHPVAPDEWPDQAPEWLRAARPWDELPQSAPDAAIPALAELAPPARQARFLRQQLALDAGARDIDFMRLCRHLAERRVPQYLPRRTCRIWPARVQLVMDICPPLRPFRGDFACWKLRLQRIFGKRLVVLIARSGYPAELEMAATGAPAVVRMDQSAVVVLSDAGMYAPQSPRHRAWLAFGARCAAAGQRPLLLAPCPEQLCSEDITALFRCVPLERGAKLQPKRGGVPARAGAVPGPDAATDLLLAALLPGARTEMPLLRELRLALAAQGTDIGSEYAVWNHPGVCSDELACALRPEQRPEARRTFESMPAATRAQLVELRAAGNRHLSPFIEMEEALCAADLGCIAQDAPRLRAARAQINRYAASLYHDVAPQMNRSLRGAITALARRRPEALAQHPQLAAAWGLAHREQLAQGRVPPLPKGLGLPQLAWLVGGSDAPRALALAQVGDQLGLHAADAPDKPRATLYEFEAAGQHWQVEGRPRAGQAAVPTVLALGESLCAPPERVLRLTVGQVRLEIEPIRRPAWAAGLGQDREGLYAELADGRKLYWVPAQTLYAVAGSSPEQRLAFS